jgi:hypothetical protein
VNNDMRGPELVRDDALTTELRALYAAPSDEAYWTTLEHRVMAALDEEESWYTVSERWLRAGLVAAAAIVLVAGGLFLRAQLRMERTMAYENVVEVEGLNSALAQREPLSDAQVTLRRLTGHQ